MEIRLSSLRLTKTWQRRSLIAFNCVLAVVLLAGLGGFGYAKWRFSQVDKIGLTPFLNESGEADAGSPMNVLLVGSDDRSDIDPSEVKKFGTASEVGPAHSDTMMVLRIDPKAERAAILSLPRDLWVDIYTPEGKNLGKEKINAAIQGGPGQLIKTINQNFNIPIDHYMQVDFNGFRGIVSAVGGVPVRFDAPARDKFSGLDIKTAGCQKLNGDQALSYVRSRHYESFESGRWREDARSDLSRIDRQQDFIRRVMRTAINKGARNPITLNNLVGASVSSVTLDETFGPTDILRVANRFRSLDPNEVEMMTLPNTISTATAGGATVSILKVKQPDADQTIDRFINGPPQPTAEVPVPIVPPSSISVRVLNGSGTSGQATDTATALKDAGFVVNGTGDSKAFGNGATSIRYAKGQKDKGDTLAKFVKGEVTVTEDTTLRGVDVVITTGSSFGGIVDPNAAATTTTSSTTEAPSNSPSGITDEKGC